MRHKVVFDFPYEEQIELYTIKVNALGKEKPGQNAPA